VASATLVGQTSNAYGKQAPAPVNVQRYGGRCASAVRRNRLRLGWSFQ
jgi:hypothetical protein